MGAKQSKRSVDISGKEAECAGEVAGAAGEGRLEQLADADTLKPQLNGDAHHIHTPDEQTEKEKQLDNGTPEIEKDVTTEKEDKEKENETEKVAPLTNGDSEPKADTVNGQETPTIEQDSGKKPKKEKVKKKWSLRSISFSRKDKPKQEKKPKEEEPKTNGEPEKVPEEVPENNAAEETAPKATEEISVAENKDEKTPETPVTEPITNGSSTPESANVEIQEKEESAAPIPDCNAQKEEPKPEPAAEPIPFNGVPPKVSIEKVEIVAESKSQEIKIEKTPAVAPEVPASENSIKTEVCVEKMALIESPPPPLPACPPPSSVASFAETMMASHLVQTSLDTSASEITPLPAFSADAASTEPASDTCGDTPTEGKVSVDIIPLSKDLPAESVVTVNETEVENTPIFAVETILSSIEAPDTQNIINCKPNFLNETNITLVNSSNDNDKMDVNLNDVPSNKEATESVFVVANVTVNESNNLKRSIETVDTVQITGKVETIEKLEKSAPGTENNKIGECVSDNDPLIASEKQNFNTESTENDTERENLINKSKDIIIQENEECNGNIEESNESTKTVDGFTESAKMATTPDDSIPPSIAELPPPEEEPVEQREDHHGSNEGSESFPAPPSDLDSEPSAASPEPQEPIPVIEKVTPEVIAEMSATVEAVALQETATDVAVAN